MAATHHRTLHLVAAAPGRSAGHPCQHCRDVIQVSMVLDDTPSHAKQLA